MGSELPAIVTQPLVEPANDDWSLGPLREPEPQVLDAKFKVVRRSDDDWEKLLCRIGQAGAVIGVLICAPLLIAGAAWLVDGWGRLDQLVWHQMSGLFRRAA